MKRFTLALGATAALLFSGFSQAENVRKVEVSYIDLDLAKAEHVNALYWRIQHAAQGVCASDAAPGSRAVLIERKCMAKAVDEAVQSVGNANLTAIYQAKTGKRAMVASSR